MTEAKNSVIVLVDKLELHNMITETIENSLRHLSNTKPTLETTTVPLLSTEELSKSLSVSDQTVNRWRQKGKIPFVKLGKSYRYDLQKVLCSLEKRTGGGI